MRLSFALAAAVAAAIPSAASAVVVLDVTVRGEPGAAFSAPIFTFTNFSSAGFRVNAVSISGGAPWDFVYDGPSGPYQILNPAGGTRTITQGQEASFNPNDGCTSGIAYSLTSFDPGDSFRFSNDPEGPGCSNAVVDIRPFLEGDQIAVGVTFSNGMMLSGSNWTRELIDSQGNPNQDANQLYRLVLSANTGVPEPSAWALMIVGFGAVGAASRRRKRAMPA